MTFQSPPYKMILFLFGIAFLFIVTGLSGCRHAEIPAIDLTFWAGDSDAAGVRRAQEGKTIRATDPAFNNLACLSYEDIRKIHSTLLTCRDWGRQQRMTRREMRYFLNKNMDTFRHVSDPN